ncbi:unnamed protein product [Paramecium sonneborni]|uniref:Uncharacterized protein n=1 Tax=Paramecium sonneborni TaxID=65129 RepID=A0A8S1R290_9CILI|nr:unnamed protein product [Paramecium sonneborni]
MNTSWRQKFQKDKLYPRHPMAHKNGGVHMNQEEDTKLFQVAGAMMKQIGTKIAKGDFNLATIPKPICLTAPLTSNECLLFDFDYSYIYLTEAAQCRDALKRMQLIVINEIAYLHGTHTFLKSLAPIDPMVGETCHRIKEDGTQFYCEFIKADPPTTLYHVIGNGWQTYGGEVVHADIHPTFSQLIGRNLKPKYIKFNDGKLYEITVPPMIINGLLKGDRVLNKLDGFLIKCVQDKLEAQINFSYVYEDNTTKIKNKLMFWSSQQQKQLSDLVDVKINKLINTDDENNNTSFTISTGSGSWLSYFEIDGDVCWRIDDPISPWIEPSYLLPSDSAFRQDKILLLKGQNDAAQTSRNSIEKQGLKDSNLRKKRR